MADGSIVIDTKLRTKQAVAELNQMQKGLSQLNAQLDKQKAKAEQTAVKFREQKAAVEEARKAAEAKTAQRDATAGQLAREEAKLLDLIDKRKQLTEIGYNDKMLSGLDAEIAQQGAQAEKTSAQLEKQQAAVDSANSKYQNQLEKLREIGSTMQQNEQTIKSTETQIDGQTQRIVQQQEVVRRSNAGVHLAQGFQTAVKPLAEVGKRLKTLAKRVLLFSLITKALRGVRSYFSSALASNEAFQNSLATLKGALRTAFQPIMDYIIPALTRLISLLAQAASAFASLMSLIFGKSLADTQASAEALYNESSAISSAGGAAADASKQIADFDEINQLQNNSGGGGGGGTTTNPNFDFADPFENIDEKKLKRVLSLVGAIGAGLAGWSIGRAFGLGLSNALGLGLSLAGAVGAVTSFLDAWENGLGVGNLATYLGSIVALAVGLGFLLSPIVGIFAAIVGAIGAGVLGLKDFLATGKLTQENTVAIQTGATAAIGALGGVVGAALQIKLHWGEISSFFANVWKKIKDIWGVSFSWFKDNVIEPIANFFGITTSDIAEFFRGCWLIIQAVWKVASNWFNTNVVQPVVTVFAPIIEAVGEKFKKAWEIVKTAWQSAAEWFNEHVIQPISNFFKGLVNGIIGFFESGLNGIVDKINAFLSVFNSIASWAGGIVGADWSGVGQLQHVSLPRLAEGAVIPANHEFAAILGDQKSGTNIETPLATMVQAFKQALGESGNGRTVVFEIDKKQFARISYDLFKAESKRVGVALGGA